MKLVEIEELEVGDEILISCQSYFKYLRILSKPSFNKHGYYKAVKCSSNRTTTTRQWTRYNGSISSYNVHEWQFGPDNHNTIQYLYLTGRQLLLINRN